MTPPSSSADFQTRLSVVVPVYNEERTLPTIIERLAKSCGDIAEFIFVNDGSNDGSLAILRSLARPQDIVVTKPNGGKGSAVRMGYAHARGTYVVVQDADLEYDPADIPPMLEKIENTGAEAAFGSRRLRRQKQFAHLSTFLGGTTLTNICNALYLSRLTDQPTCYKMIRNDILRTFPLRENDFRFDPELTVFLLRRGCRIVEVPISYQPRTYAEGKKIVWQDWFKWVWVFISLRFAPQSHFMKTA